MAKNVQVQSSFLIATFGSIIDSGFTAAPNLLLEHGVDVGLSDKAILFILQVLRAKFKTKDGIIVDADLCMDSSEKTLYRIRKDLSNLIDENGEKLIIIKSFYSKSDAGKIEGAGTSYDFSRLFDYIVRKFPPTSQNDVSESPTGLFVRADSATEQPISQNVRAIQDKMTDTLKDIDTKKYKTSRTREPILSVGGWKYYSDETATFEDDPKIYNWRTMTRALPMEIMQIIAERDLEASKPLHKR